MSRAPLPIFRRSLAESWRSTIGWSAGLAGALGLYLPLYPAMAGAEMRDLLASLPPELINTLGYSQITTGAGYAQATFFGLIGFLLITIAAVAWGAAAIAGAEESGRLELVLAHGVGRVSYALEMWLAIVVRLGWLAAFSGLVLWVLNAPSELGLTAGGIVAAATSFALLGLLTASLSLAVGALTGQRRWAVGAGTGLAVLAYVLNAVGNQNPDLEFLHAFSPYDWAYGHSPLLNGLAGTTWALLASSAMCVLVATIALQRRDISG